MSGRITADDDAGRHWEGEREGNTITWESNDGLKGTETLDNNGNGVSTTGDVVPCDYADDGTYTGDCPSGTYEEHS